jgi:AcrR family transcriptional regulator
MVKSRAARPAEPEAGDLRERILRASIDLIEQQGLAALSLREVARRAGVSHQAPYHHFQDREAILAALAEEGFRMLGDRIEGSTQGKDDRAPLARLTACGRAYVDFACAQPAYFRIMFRPELVDLTQCPTALAEGDRTFGLLRARIHALALAGFPAVPSEEPWVALAWSVAHGLACLILDGPLAIKMPDASRDAQIQGVLEAFERMLTATLEAAKPAGPSRAAGSPKKRAKRG